MKILNGVVLQAVAYINYFQILSNNLMSFIIYKTNYFPQFKNL